jgi:hypothetical protein
MSGVAFVVSIGLTGMVALGTSPNPELLGLLVRESQGHQMAAANSKAHINHRPVFEFKCGDFIGVSGIDRSSGATKILPNDPDVPCSIFPAAEHRDTFDKSIDLSEGFDIEVYVNASIYNAGLEKLNCVSKPDYCECTNGGRRSFCSFSEGLSMDRIQARSSTLLADLFASSDKLTDDMKKIITGRVMMRGGRMGTVKDSSSAWLFSKPVVSENDHTETGDATNFWYDDTFISPSKGRWDIDVPTYNTQQGTISLVFVRHSGGSSFALNFTQGASPVKMMISNEIRLEDLCERKYDEYDHFGDFYLLAKPVVGRVGLVQQIDNPGKACSDRKAAILAGRSSGKYPIMCLNPVMQGQALPAPY